MQGLGLGVGDAGWDSVQTITAWEHTEDPAQDNACHGKNVWDNGKVVWSVFGSM